jgi:hypothetical protein
MDLREIIYEDRKWTGPGIMSTLISVVPNLYILLTTRDLTVCGIRTLFPLHLNYASSMFGQFYLVKAKWDIQ